MSGNEETVEVNSRNGQAPVGATAKSVAEHASTLTRLELELALLELKRKAAALGFGLGTAAAAIMWVFFGVALALGTAVVALDLVVDLWLAFLIVTGAALLLAAIFALLARSGFRNAAPPVPEQAIEQAKLTTSALKG
jgi:heme A synthase